MRKIFIIANSRYPHGTANSVNVFRMAEAFSKLGLKVNLLAIRSSFLPQKKIWGLTCQRYGAQPAVKPRFLWWPFSRGAEPALALAGLLQLLFGSRRTIIFTRVRYVAFLASLLGYHSVFESHAPPNNRLQLAMESRFLQKARTNLILISEGLRSVYKELGLPLEKDLIAHDAGRQWRPTPPSKHEFVGPCLNIGYIGSLLPGRGIEIILALAQSMPHRKFHLFGNLNSTSRMNLPAPPNLIFYGEVTPSQAEMIASIFDILLMPYQKETKIGNGLDTTRWMSPMKMFEYMFSGRPMISSDLPALTEVLKNNETALLVPSDDINAWEDALNKMDNPEVRWSLARNAFEQASLHHTWDLRVKRILKHLETV
jgi:glycosyltransferase involved in cell wall biosynthesis